MAALLLIALFLGMTGYSSATYCICKDGVGESYLQKNIDFACGAGADCSPILQNGGCYQPNTVKAHCDYAVNSYYQKKGQVTGSCDFSGSAIVTSTLPSSVVSSCTYPASPSQVTGSGSGSTTTGTTTTSPTTGTTGSAGTTGSTTTGSTTYGLAPTGTGIDSTGSSSASHHHHHASSLVLAVTTLFSGLLVLWG